MSEAQPPERRMVTIVEPGNLRAERAAQRRNDANANFIFIGGGIFMLFASLGALRQLRDGVHTLFDTVTVIGGAICFVGLLVAIAGFFRNYLRGARPIPGVAVVDAYLEEEWDRVREDENYRLTTDERTEAFHRLYYAVDELQPWLEERHRLLGEPEMAQDLRRAELIIRATLRRKVREERALPTQIMHELGEQDPAPTSVTPDELAEEVRRAEERAQRERRPRRSNPPMPT